MSRDFGLFELLLGQREIEVNRIQRLQGDDRRAGRQILTGIDRPHSEMPAKGSPQRVFFQNGLLFGDLCLRRGQCRCGGVELLLADQLPVELGFVAVVIGLREILRGLQRMQPRRDVPIAQMQDRRARLDLAAGIEVHLIDDARHFHRQIGAAYRLQRANHPDLRHPVLEMCHDRGDSNRRLLRKTGFHEGENREREDRGEPQHGKYCHQNQPQP